MTSTALAITTREAARRLTKKGWGLVRLAAPDSTGPSPGKRALGAGWQRSPIVDPRRAWAYWTRRPTMNIGVVLGQVTDGRPIAIDYDPRNTTPESRKYWEKELEPMLREAGAIINHSGRGDGGGHYLFQSPNGHPLRSTLIAPGIELKADGAQIVTAPSLHPDTGKPYRVEGTDDGLLPPASHLRPFPDVLKDHIQAKVDSASGPVVRGERGRKASPSELDALRQGIAGMPLDPGGRHDRLGAWIMDAFYCGMEVEEIEELAEEYRSRAGRAKGEQPNEVRDWLRDAKRRVESGQEIRIQTPGICAELVFREELERDAFAAELGVDREDDPPPAELVDKETAAELQEMGSDWRLQLDKNQNGNLKAVLRNIVLILENDDRFAGLLGYNEMQAQTTLLRPPPWDERRQIGAGASGAQIIDQDDLCLADMLAQHYPFHPTTGIVRQAVDRVAFSRPFHPVRDWLGSLQWDGEPRIDTWLQDYASAEGDPAFVSAVGRMWLVAAVARAFRPGCTAQHIPIFEGAQGVGKSTLLRIMGGLYYLDAPIDLANTRYADLIDSLMGYWIVELAELAALRRADQERIKAFATRTTDRVRLAYGHRALDFPRNFVLAGTTNQSHYLGDETGNRRFWPVKVGRVRFNALESARTQLWAEAVHAYRGGEKWHIIDPKLERKARRAQEDRYDADEWEAVLREWLDSQRLDRVAGLDLYTEALEGTAVKFGRAEQHRVAAAMRRLGWLRQTYRGEDGAPVKGYLRPE